MKPKYSKGEYIVYSSEVDCGVFLLETDEQLEQAELDSNISLFRGTKEQAKEIVELRRILNNLLEERHQNIQRIKLLRNNIKMMCLK